MLKTVLITILAISATRQTCDAGCLKCTTTGDCVIPDLLNSYYLSGSTATKTSLTNCVLSGIDGKCVICNAGFYLDAATNKCVAVPTANIIANCAAYSSATSCSLCDQDYYLNTNVCTAVETKIANCDYYNNASTCFACASSYLLSLDSKSCAAMPSISNCGDFTFVKCNTCDSGYVLNPNNYLASALIATSTADKNFLTSFAYFLSDENSQIVAQNACQVQSTTNCALFDEGVNTCTTCSSGYYLDIKASCVIFPDEPIENCLHYSAVNTCKECVSGYYFKSKVCTQISGTDVIANCSTYSGSATTVTCLTCANNYYLKNNSCTIRDKSLDSKIANCGIKANGDDKCDTCNAGYVLANDGLFCFTAIANCSTYVSTASGQVLRCDVCNDTYYRTVADSTGTNTCQPGGVSNCKEYPEGVSLTCNICLNKYILLNSVCAAHNSIDKCDTYNTSLANYCVTCQNPGYFNFTIDKYCQTISTNATISQCATYSGDISSPVCSSCNSGYFLKDGACAAVTITDCLALDSANNCSTCKSGKAVSLDGASCEQPPSFITDNCLANDTADGNNTQFAKNVECEICQNTAVPFDNTGSYVCISYDEAKQYTASPPTSKIDNVDNRCIKYNNSFECIQCDVDNDKPYLNPTTKACVATCTYAVNKFVLANINSAADNGSWNISQLNVCQTADNADGCGVYAPDLTNSAGNFPNICIKCKSTYIDVLTAATAKYSNVDPSAATLSLFFPSAQAKFPQVTCSLKTDITKIGGVANTSPITRCSYHKVDFAGDFSCLRCEYGYTGTLNASGKITACTQDTTCTTEKLYNLSTFINNIASCHKCSNSAIPFIAYKATSSSNPTFVDFGTYITPKTAATYEDVSLTNKNIACRSVLKSNFITGGTGNAVSANCGIAVLLINTDGVFSDGDGTYGIYCAACKPTFKPTAVTNVAYPYVYADCVAIANCASTSTYFNACSSCNSGYILKYASDDIDFTTCLSIPTSTSTRFNNCLAASVSGATTNADVCQICKSGYFLNDDNICEKYQPVNCTDNLFTPIQKKSFKANVFWSIPLNANTVGCSKCKSGYIGYDLGAKKLSCLKSAWVLSSVDTQTVTNYIPYCKYYGIDGADSYNRYCKTCTTPYVISGTGTGASIVIDGNQCFSNATINNCAVAKDANTCLRCNDVTFSLKNDKCELGNIANCLAYSYDISYSAVKCVTCAADYYLDTANNACVLGGIYNCKALTNDNALGCNVCQSGFVKLSNLNNTNDYCYPMDASLGCSDMTVTNDSANSAGNIKCNSCTNNTNQLIGSVPSTANKTICMAYSSIANCKSYIVGTSLVTSSYRCQVCNDGFYLNSNNRCMTRVNQPSKCTTYIVSQDQCSACDNTSYLNTAGTICTDYPKGIIGCRTYTDATTCSACKDGRYLNANVCSKVTTAIANCFYYSSNTSCSACSSGYALLNNTCIKATAANCATYSSDTVCATCISGYVLQTTSNVTNCVAQTKIGCITIDINTPYNCMACSAGYYLEAGECKNPTLISNCATYDSKTACSKCNKGFALSVDKAACVNSVPTVSYIDSQCIDSQVTSTAVCARCDAGFYFVNGACSGSCNISGCLACDPKDAASCYVCKAGYYQSKDGACNIDNPVSSTRILMGAMTALVAFISLIL